MEKISREIAHTPNTNNPKTRSQVREKLETEREASVKEAKADAQRRANAKRAGTQVRGALVDFDDERDRQADERKQSRAEFVESFAGTSKLKENVAKYAQAAAKQPSLIERLAHESARERAKAQALKRVAKAVYSGGADDDWRATAVDAEIFDESERAQ